jgi:hypothetical protein
MATRYLYLRTKLALEHSSEAVSSLGALADYSPDVFGIGKFRLVWQDGMVVRFESSQTPKAICHWLGPKLSKFEAWACHDGLSRCHDFPLGAQASTFFEGLGSKSVSQLFLQYNKDDFRQEQLIERLKSTLEFNAKAKCRSVVDFRNGKIVLIAANEPSRITFNRCHACLRDEVRYVFLDGGRVCHSARDLIEDEDAWTQMVFSVGRGFGTA